jgi:hypothetical protein
MFSRPCHSQKHFIIPIWREYQLVVLFSPNKPIDQTNINTSNEHGWLLDEESWACCLSVSTQQIKLWRRPLHSCRSTTRRDENGIQKKVTKTITKWDQIVARAGFRGWKFSHSENFACIKSDSNRIFVPYKKISVLTNIFLDLIACVTREFAKRHPKSHAQTTTARSSHGEFTARTDDERSRRRRRSFLQWTR